MRTAWRGMGRAMTLLVLASASLSAQVRPTPPRPPQDTARRDTTRRDTTARDVRRDTAASWMAPDPIMQALMQRQGVSVTRYEGATVRFENGQNAFSIKASDEQKAQVERDGQRVGTDSTIVYQNRRVDVNGAFQMTPGAGQPPIAGFGSASYDMAGRAGTMTNARLTVDESGSPWYVGSEIGKVIKGDSTRNISDRFYGIDGVMTSCEDSVPDYHFAMKEIKRTKNTLVARPAVMYIRDIPVMWFPFVVQDIRSGRRSGVLPPRFGFTDIVRNNPNYRRHVENIGYYWAASDYFDVASWIDWRSAGGGDEFDPGWTKGTIDMKYRWSSRFLDGSLATGYQHVNNGQNNTTVSWTHNQRFGERTFAAQMNYTSDTKIQRQNTFNPYQAVSTIYSSVTYTDAIGPAKISLGGDRRQFPGRKEVQQGLPKFSITSPAIALFSWLTWTPNFSYSETSRLHMDSPSQFNQRFFADSTGRLLRADSLNRNEVDRNISFDTPLRIFKYDFRTNIRIHDWVKNYPEQRDVFVNADTTRRETRVYPRMFGTELDWNPEIRMPSFANNIWKITPSVSYSNIDSKPFWLRSYFNGGQWVHQNKRFTYSLSAAPTIFGIFPGLGPFSAFRHTVSPTISYSISPNATINREYLVATGQAEQTFTGGRKQSAISFGLSTNVEGKVVLPADSGAAENSRKLKILSLQFTPIAYDFVRAKALNSKLAGLSTENFGTRLSSDLLPGMDFSFDYSLFRGSLMTDTAEFDPFLTHVSTSLRFSNRENPFTVISGLFNTDQRGALSRDSMPRMDQQNPFARQGAMPVAGQGARASQLYVPQVDGWQASLSFSMSRSRPPRPGDQVVNSDPAVFCQRYLQISQFAYQECFNNPTEAPSSSPYGGGPQFIGPPQINTMGDIRFKLTPKWSAAWNSSFDFVRHEFGLQMVTLQRDMHDWSSVFAFTRSPNGNFSFTFNIALKPQPDIKFDYSKASIRGQ